MVDHRLPVKESRLPSYTGNGLHVTSSACATSEGAEGSSRHGGTGKVVYSLGAALVSSFWRPDGYLATLQQVDPSFCYKYGEWPDRRRGLTGSAVGVTRTF